MDFNERNTVKVEFSVMERLVRDSERLNAIKDLARKHTYVTSEELRVLLGLDKEGEK